MISGTGVARHKDGTTPIGPGDAFIFPPGEAHQLTNDGSQDLILYVVADNPIGESSSLSGQPKMGGALTRTPTDPFRAAGRVQMVKNEFAPV